MRINFDDCSFLDIVESSTEGKAATVILCGIDGKNVTMSSAELDEEQVKEIYTMLGEILEKEKEDD